MASVICMLSIYAYWDGPCELRCRVLDQRNSINIISITEKDKCNNFDFFFKFFIRELFIWRIELKLLGIQILAFDTTMDRKCHIPF